MGFDSIVLVKQVPDTAHISDDVMKPDGTINRAMLPAVFNPEDRVALELALQIKDRYGGTVTAITMGPPKASEILRECYYSGADSVYLISDRKFAGADTLATSYVLSEAIKKIGNFDIIFAGRQAIDGDTAQVGPQIAEKLGLPQLTYTEKILKITRSKITVKRQTDIGYEILESTLPALITVVEDAARPRPFKAKRVMFFKNAKSLLELEAKAEENPLTYVENMKLKYQDKKLFIPTITRDELDIEMNKCGLEGSPTKVYKIESVVVKGGEHIKIEPSQKGLNRLVAKLIEDRIFG